jgi:hypothetical protein
MGIISGLSAIIGLACICVFLGFAISFFKLKVLKNNREKPTENIQVFLSLCNKNHLSFIIGGLVIVLLSAFSCTTIREIIGYDNIGLKPDGEYCYFVNLSNGRKTYTLPAKIYIDSSEENRKTYDVSTVYWSNGGYLYFDNDDYISDFHEKISTYDQNDNKWEINIINKSAYCPRMKETSTFDNWFNVVFEFLIVISEIGVWIMCLSYYKNEK